ncbi:MAG: aminotransferase class I/II-fold pyridoxal phosphate-dependent enzyme [Planctomycetota bacterium]|jgi:alanine-synthesizing transaminase
MAELETDIDRRHASNRQIEPAQRIKRLPPYLFGRLNALKLAKRQAGVDIIDLGMGNPSDPAPQIIIDKLCEAAQDPRNHRYSASKGIKNLRKGIAKKYEAKWNVQLDPDTEVLACIGSKEGFSHLCLAMMGPGDTAVVPDPTFPIHNYAVALAGANVVSVPLGNDEKFINNVTMVIENMYPTPKLLILNYPHNPTAMTVDEGFFEPGVEFITMSKPYNMAGFRIGFVAGNKNMIDYLATIKGYYDYGIFQAIQIAGIIALRHCEEDIAVQNQRYRSRRDVVCEGLSRIGWEVEKPRATMFVWAKVPKEHSRGKGSIDYAMDLMEHAEVSIAPGRAFGEGGEDCMRIALVENEQRLRQAVRNISRYVRKSQ